MADRHDVLPRQVRGHDMTRPGIALGRPRHDPAIRLGIEEIVVGRVGLQYDTHIRICWLNSGSLGISQRVASVDTDRTVSRLRGEACVSISIIASLSTRSDGSTRSNSWRPASVSATPRPPRRNSMTPSRDSRRLMLRLTPPCVISRPSAAAVMHPARDGHEGVQFWHGEAAGAWRIAYVGRRQACACACRQCACRNLDGRLRAGHAAVKGLVSVGGQFALKFKFYRP